MDPDEALAVVRDFADDPVEARWLRALGEYMTILQMNEEVAKVVSESGNTYLVNPVEGWCDCPDHDKRGVECKHLRRVAAEQGQSTGSVDDVAASLSALDAAIDQEVTRLEARIEDLRAAQREFQRLDERLAEITPDGADPGTRTGKRADSPGVADD